MVFLVPSLKIGLARCFGVLKRFGYGGFLREALNEWTLKFGSELSRYAVTSLMPW